MGHPPAAELPGSPNTNLLPLSRQHFVPDGHKHPEKLWTFCPPPATADRLSKPQTRVLSQNDAVEGALQKQLGSVCLGGTSIVPVQSTLHSTVTTTLCAAPRTKSAPPDYAAKPKQQQRLPTLLALMDKWQLVH
jgi:hypothetical protein